MSSTITLAGLLIDSWRDQSPQGESSEMNLPGSTAAVNRFRESSDDGPATPRMASLIALGVVKWESYQGENL